MLAIAVQDLIFSIFLSLIIIKANGLISSGAKLFFKEGFAPWFRAGYGPMLTLKQWFPTRGSWKAC